MNFYYGLDVENDLYQYFRFRVTFSVLFIEKKGYEQRVAWCRVRSKYVSRDGRGSGRVRLRKNLYFSHRKQLIIKW